MFFKIIEKSCSNSHSVKSRIDSPTLCS
uniref:Uncharacterized protein n=1 Tax=Rhizophora mucronata TaxID=61149 RepID=A0A2P2N7R0_RHIMU